MKHNYRKSILLGVALFLFLGACKPPLPTNSYITDKETILKIAKEKGWEFSTTTPEGRYIEITAIKNGLPVLTGTLAAPNVAAVPSRVVLIRVTKKVKPLLNSSLFEKGRTGLNRIDEVFSEIDVLEIQKIAHLKEPQMEIGQPFFRWYRLKLSIGTIETDALNRLRHLSEVEVAQGQKLYQAL